MKNSSRPYCRDIRGSIAILTLWAILFLALLSLSLSGQVAARLLVASDMKWGPQIRALGSKALADVLTVLAEDKTVLYDSLQESWAGAGAGDEKRFKDVPYGGGSYALVHGNEDKARYGLQDEERKINVNRSPPAVISRLLRFEGGLSERDADELADSIVDWRDVNATKERGTGTMPEDCLSASLPARCKNTDYEVLEELLWIPGMTGALFKKIRDHLTLYGGGPSNINTATETSLKAVGLSETAVSRIVAWRADNRFESPTEILGRSGALGLSKEDLAGLQAAVSSGLLGVRSDFFEGVVQVRFGDRVRGHVSFIVNRMGEVKSWKE